MTPRDYPKLMSNRVEMSPDRGFFRGAYPWTKRSCLDSISSMCCVSGELRGDFEAIGLTQQAEFEEEERQLDCRFKAHSNVRLFSWRLP